MKNDNSDNNINATHNSDNKQITKTQVNIKEATTTESQHT